MLQCGTSDYFMHLHCVTVQGCYVTRTRRTIQGAARITDSESDISNFSLPDMVAIVALRDTVTFSLIEAFSVLTI